MQDTWERPLPSLLLSGSSAGEEVLSLRKPGCESWLVHVGHEYGTEHAAEVSVERAGGLGDSDQLLLGNRSLEKACSCRQVTLNWQCGGDGDQTMPGRPGDKGRGLQGT